MYYSFVPRGLGFRYFGLLEWGREVLVVVLLVEGCSVVAM